MRRATVALALVVFLATAARGRDRQEAVGDERAGALARGARLFAAEFAPDQGLGPLFNHTSCLGCHRNPSPGGTGPDGLGTVVRVGRLTAVGFDPMHDRGGPIARARSVSERGLPCDLAPGIPAGANLTSVRNAPALYGVGLIDAIADEVTGASGFVMPSSLRNASATNCRNAAVSAFQPNRPIRSRPSAPRTRCARP